MVASLFRTFALAADFGAWLVLALMLPGLIVIAGVVMLFLFRRPEVPTAVDTPGYFHVLGIDRSSGTKREATYKALSETSARGLAELDQILVTEIRRVKDEQ